MSERPIWGLLKGAIRVRRAFLFAPFGLSGSSSSSSSSSRRSSSSSSSSISSRADLDIVAADSLAGDEQFDYLHPRLPHEDYISPNPRPWCRSRATSRRATRGGGPWDSYHSKMERQPCTWTRLASPRLASPPRLTTTHMWQRMRWLRWVNDLVWCSIAPHCHMVSHRAACRDTQCSNMEHVKESRAKRGQTSCQLRPPFLGTPLVPCRSMKWAGLDLKLREIHPKP